MNTKVTRKQIEEARNYLFNINTQLGMTLYDPELAEIIEKQQKFKVKDTIQRVLLQVLVMVVALWVNNAHREL